MFVIMTQSIYFLFWPKQLHKFVVNTTSVNHATRCFLIKHNTDLRPNTNHNQ